MYPCVTRMYPCFTFHMYVTHVIMSRHTSRENIGVHLLKLTLAACETFNIGFRGQKRKRFSKSFYYFFGSDDHFAGLIILINVCGS